MLGQFPCPFLIIHSLIYLANSNEDDYFDLNDTVMEGESNTSNDMSTEEKATDQEGSEYHDQEDGMGGHADDGGQSLTFNVIKSIRLACSDIILNFIGYRDATPVPSPTTS